MKMPVFLSWIGAIRKKTNYAIYFLSAATILASCSDDEDKFAADTAKAVGTYSVEDTAEWGEVESYSIKISKASSGGPNLEITNFGDIMYVPVNAVLQGNSLVIPAQTFKGKSMTIMISGTGKLNGGTLTFDYSIDTGDDSSLEHSCVAVKQVN